LHLDYLNCSGNHLTSLDISNNTQLVALYCSSNTITNIDVLNNSLLTTLKCVNNDLTNIDLSNNTLLTTLHCSSNNITSLDVSNNTQLTTLWCSFNNLTNLGVANNTQLNSLRCITNDLTSLDVSNNSLLTFLTCYDNNLNYLDMRNDNNGIITSFGAGQNSNLTCIFVDDVAYSTANWTSIDENTTFVEDEEACNELSVKNQEITSFDVYPNPTNSFLHIESNIEVLRIKVYNELGQLLLSKMKQNSIDISNLTSGIYFLKIEDKQNTIEIKKIIKE